MPRTAHRPQEILSAEETADFLGVSTSTLANWRYLRRGPAFVRQGRIVRYTADAPAAWLSTHEVSTDA